MLETLRYNLTRLMGYDNISIEKLSKRSGIPSIEIERLLNESESYKPKMSMIRDLAKALDVTWYELLKGKPEMKPLHVSCNGNPKKYQRIIDSAITDIENYNFLTEILSK